MLAYLVIYLLFDGEGMKLSERKEGSSSSQINLGIELVSSVLIGALGGYGLDRRLDTTPWLFLVGLIVGSAAGLLNTRRFNPSEDIEKRGED